MSPGVAATGENCALGENSGVGCCSSCAMVPMGVNSDCAPRSNASTSLLSAQKSSLTYVNFSASFMFTMAVTDPVPFNMGLPSARAAVFSLQLSLILLHPASTNLLIAFSLEAS